MNTTQTAADDQTVEYSPISYEVFIEPNPDSWRGGYQWSVNNGDEELECGLAPSRRLAMSTAKKLIADLIKSPL
jgi:hypothetical protein